MGRRKTSKLSRRRGVAELEFAMVLPLIVSFWVLYMYSAKVWLERIELENKARYETWTRRDDLEAPVTGVRPLVFEPTESSNKGYDPSKSKNNNNADKSKSDESEYLAQGSVAIEAKKDERTIETGFIFDAWEHKAKTEQKIYADSWDYETYRRKHIKEDPFETDDENVDKTKIDDPNNVNNIGTPDEETESPGRNVRVFLFQQGGENPDKYNFEGVGQSGIYRTNLPYYEPKQGPKSGVGPTINKAFE